MYQVQLSSYFRGSDHFFTMTVVSAWATTYLDEVDVQILPTLGEEVAVLFPSGVVLMECVFKEYDEDSDDCTFRYRATIETHEDLTIMRGVSAEFVSVCKR